MIKDLNLQPYIIKLLEVNFRKTLQHICKGKDFLEKNPEAQAITAKTDKWDYISLRSTCTAKETFNKVKRQLKEWDKIFANYATNKGSISRVYKELQILNNNKTNNPVKKCAKDMNRHFSKEEIQMADTWNNVQDHYPLGKCKTKTTLRFFFTTVRMAIIQKQTNKQKMIKAGDDVQKKLPISTFGGNVN